MPSLTKSLGQWCADGCGFPPASGLGIAYICYICFSWVSRLNPETSKALKGTEREGFEPSEGLTLQQISSLPHSTTLPPLQNGSGLSYRRSPAPSKSISQAGGVAALVEIGLKSCLGLPRNRSIPLCPINGDALVAQSTFHER
jgi:hypothetical protein